MNGTVQCEAQGCTTTAELEVGVGMDGTLWAMLPNGWHVAVVRRVGDQHEAFRGLCPDHGAPAHELVHGPAEPAEPAPEG